jgi:hypothetical protein
MTGTADDSEQQKVIDDQKHRSACKAVPRCFRMSAADISPGIVSADLLLLGG